MVAEESKTGKQYLGLTSKQRKLLYGDLQFQRSDQLVKIINDKARRLPKRLDNILTDIDALNEANFFTSEWEPPVSETIKQNCQDEWQSFEWELTLREILDDEGIIGEISEGTLGELPASPDGKIQQYNKNSRAKNFGQSVGVAVHQLTQDCMSDEAKRKLLAGLFEGYLLGKKNTKNKNIDKQTISKAIEYIESIDWESILQIHNADLSTRIIHPREKQNKELAKQVMDQEGLSETQTLSDHIIDNAFDVESIQSCSTKSIAVEEDVIRTRINRGSLPYYKNRPVKEKKLLRGELIVKLRKRNTKIDRAEKLIQTVKITNIHLDGEILDVFEKLYKAHTNNRHKSVNLIISHPKNHFGDDWGSDRGRVNTLNGQKIPLKGIELVSQNSSEEWKLTPLGELVGYMSIDQQSEYPIDELCHKFVLDEPIDDKEERLIDEAISTFDSNNPLQESIS
jgi:hypothetical protein